MSAGAAVWDAAKGCRREDVDWQGALTWHRILDAIERLQAKAPAEGEATH